MAISINIMQFHVQDEATAISNVIGFIEEDRYDVVVFDTAPTGHTLKLLNLPKVASWFLNDII